MRNKTPLLIAHITPELSELKQMRHTLNNVLMHYSIDKERIENVMILATEHLSNVIRHSALTTEISIYLEKENNGFVLTFIDDGSSISELLETADDLNKLNNNGQLLSAGMGLPLIKGLFPDLVYSQSPDVNKKDNSSEQQAKRHNTLSVRLTSTHTLPSIVLVDDDLTTLILLEELLGDDFDVLSFSDPEKALRTILSCPPDLVISDIKMPTLDGFELRRALASHQQTCTIPFIFLTGQSEDHERAAMLSIDDFLEKPANKYTLIQTIKRVMNRSKDLKRSINAELDHAITHSLWSPLPQSFESIAIDSAFEVASRGGGDFIFSAQQKDSLIIVLGDVMGHGEQAKFFAHAIGGFIHGLFMAQKDNLSPAGLLNQCSYAANKSPLLSKTLITCLAIEIKSDGSIILASAGHPYPWLVSSDHSDAKKQIKNIKVEGVLLGLTEHTDYKEVTVKLQENEVLLCYSDGLTECLVNDIKTDQEDAIKHYLSGRSRVSPCLTATNLLNELQNADFHQAIDDLTLITLKKQIP